MPGVKFALSGDSGLPGSRVPNLLGHQANNFVYDFTCVYSKEIISK